MDNERTRDQENSSGKPGGDRGHEPGSAADGFLLLAVLLVLFAAAAFIAIGMPQALEIATCHVNASAAIFTDSKPTHEGDRALEGVEEESEPLIVDDLRTEGVMYALADVPGVSAAERLPMTYDTSSSARLRGIANRCSTNGAKSIWVARTLRTWRIDPTKHRSASARHPRHKEDC